MSKTKTYDIFEVEGEGYYYFGPNEFANDPQFPYTELKLWKFRNDEYCLSLLQKKKKILLAYGTSEKLDNFLVERGVATEEFKVLEVQNDGWKLRLQGGYKLELEHRWSYAYCLSKNYKDTFFSFFDGADLSSEGPNMAPNLVVDKKVTHTLRVEGNEDGSEPEELNQYLTGSQIESNRSSSAVKNIVYAIFLIIVMYLAWMAGSA